jgi:hypothetical protein
MESISKRVESCLVNAAAVITDGLNNYDEVKAAIEAKKAELKELYGVENELLNLSVILNSQDAVRVKFEESKAAVRTEIDELQAKFDALETDYINKESTLKNDLNDKRKKEEAEYKYNLERSRKIDQDTWNDKKAAFEKEIDAKADAMDAREQAIEAKAEYIAELEAKVASIPTLVADAADKAAKDAETSAKKSFGFESQMLKKDADAAAKLSEATINTLKATVERLEAENKSLNDKLTNAYSEIKDMATKTVDGAANTRAYNTLEGIVKDMQVGKNQTSK